MTVCGCPHPKFCFAKPSIASLCDDECATAIVARSREA